MWSLRVILAITALSCVFSKSCPLLGNPCDRSYRCGENERCYDDLDGKNSSFCCDDKGEFCTATGLRSGYRNNGIYSQKYQTSLDTKLYYMDKATGVACPVPFAASPLDGEHILPEGYSENLTEPLKSCDNNQLCGEGFFCKKPNNEMIDGQKSFCYKTPVLYKAFRISLTSKSKVIDCNTTSQCNNSLCVHAKVNYSKGICIEGNFCENGASIATHNKMAIVCNNAKDCKAVKYANKTYAGECKPFDPHNKLSKGICCFTVNKCSYGISLVPKMQCNSTLECNLRSDHTPVRGKWSNWCDKRGFCCHDPKNTTTGMCPDQATPAFNEVKCERSKVSKRKSRVCPNRPEARCSFNHCCPRLEIYEDREVLAKRLYATNMPCDENDDVPNPFRYAYCNGSFLVVIGLLDTSGREYVRDQRDIQCQTNKDCLPHGLSFCVRESTTDVYCYRDPFSTVSAEEDEEYWHIIVIIVIILIVLTFIALLIIKCKKYLRNYLRRRAVEKIENEKRRAIRAIEKAEEQKLFVRKFCDEFMGSCRYTRFEVGMPKTLPRDMLDELIHVGYEDFADRYDFSYEQSRKEWEKWTGDLMDNVLAQELVAKKEKTAETIFIPREVEITKEDLDRGKKEQPEISLQDVYFNEKDYCVYKIGSDIDNVELEPSTESDPSSSSDDESEANTKEESKADKKKKEEGSTPKGSEGTSKSKTKSKSGKKGKSNGRASTSKSTKSNKQKKADDAKKAMKDEKPRSVRNETAQKSTKSTKQKKADDAKKAVKDEKPRSVRNETAHKSTKSTKQKKADDAKKAVKDENPRSVRNETAQKSVSSKMSKSKSKKGNK